MNVKMFSLAVAGAMILILMMVIGACKSTTTPTATTPT
jgi:hypothetical protein